MSALRLASSLALVFAACAAYETTAPSYAPPPPDAPPPTYTPPPPDAPPPDAPAAEIKVAIASVQLLEDCPDPEPEIAAPSASRSMPSPSAHSQRKVRESSADGESFRRSCSQSTVQLSVTSSRAGRFRVEAARVLDAASLRPAGPVNLRAPTRWDAQQGTYAAWDEQLAAGVEARAGYKLGDPDFSRAAELVGPTFNTYGGPFVLELEVSVDGRRQTVRSSEFSREPPDMMVT
jgi:hypothetical protein